MGDKAAGIILRRKVKKAAAPVATLLIDAYARDGYNTIKILNRNFKEMKERDLTGADNYYHARAAYETAQGGIERGLLGQFWLLVKEANDIRKTTTREQLADSKKDLKNNLGGFILGLQNPDVPAARQEKLLDFMDKKKYPKSTEKLREILMNEK